MEEWKSELIATVVSSDAFPSDNKELDQRVLEYLAEHSLREQRGDRTERHLAEKFFPIGYGGKIAMYISRLDEHLGRYFATNEGRRQTHRIEIIRGRQIDPADRYAICFVLNGQGLLHTFWQAFIDRRVRTLVAYGVPLFLRNAEQTVFKRNATVNVPADVKAPDLSEEICWSFVKHGDLLAAFELTRWLTAQGVVADLGAFKADSGLQAFANLPADLNVIVLGSIRANGILDEYQQLELRSVRDIAPRHLPFRLRLFDVVRVDAEQRVVATFGEERHRGTSRVPVVITRRRGANRSFITLIASNHGRAVFRAAQLLTRDAELQDMFSDDRFRGWAAKMPETFQLLLYVTVLAREDVGGPWVLEDVWSE
ncbi:MAG TPA: hypothetical protein VF883_23375 [Thermoanaerobaculia bacterium]|jgi:hypothetical protein